MRDVTEQLVAYAEILDRAAPPLDELSALPAPPPRPPRRFQPRAVWAVIAGAAAVLVVVGGIAALSRRTTTTTVPPTETTTATTTVPVPEVTIELLNPQAVTPATFEWEHAFAGPGGVALVDGTFHMMSAAYGDGVATVGYATSSDGVVWTQGLNRPVLDLASAPWAPLEFDHALPRSLAVDGAGLWHLYFEIAWLDKATDEFRASIGRATTRDPAGLWVFDAEPVLRPDAAVPWRSKRVGSPSVLWEDGAFTMLFVAYGDGGGVVGRAVSDDGFVWEVAASPVLEPTSEWERGEIARVDLIRFDAGYVAVYSGDTTSRRGLAVSFDGVQWFPHPENPIMTTSDLPRASVFDSEFIANEAGLLALVENGGVRSEREVAVLQIETDLATILEALTD